MRQGCVLAPSLFCRAIDWIMGCCASSLETMVSSSPFTDLDYANDAVLFTSDPDLLDTVLCQFETEANAVRLHTSRAETKLLNVAYGQPPLSVDIDVSDIDGTRGSRTEFVLSTWALKCHPPAAPDIHRRIGLAYSNMDKLDRV